MKTTSIQIDKALHSEYKEYCKEKGYSMQGLVEVLIKQKMNDSKEEHTGGNS
jgi:hypothetical protein